MSNSLPKDLTVETLKRQVRLWQGLCLALLALAGFSLALLFLAWQKGQPELEGVASGSHDQEEPAPSLTLIRRTFDQLPGWSGDDLVAASTALEASCRVFGKMPSTKAVGPEGLGGRAADWRPFCQAVTGLAAPGAVAALGAAAAPTELGAAAAPTASGQPDSEAGSALRRVLEAHLIPLAVANRGEGFGLITGYYEPTLQGSRTRTGRYRFPLYRRPPELVQVDLGAFRDDLRGRRLAGRVLDGRLRPYADRREIEAGSLADRGLELVWVDDPVDAFFVQIQGSGRVELREGGSIRVGYDGQNGHPYYPIGRELVRRGALALEEVSMQSIERWLVENSEGAPDVMATNASFVFFRELVGSGPVGSLGVVLTPRRSLAVDAKFLPLGAPVWLSTTLPDARETVPDETPDGSAPVWFNQLMVAQDTGGAIRGPVRGDVFWGAGEKRLRSRAG